MRLQAPGLFRQEIHGVPDFVTNAMGLRFVRTPRQTDLAMDNTILVVEDDPELQEVLALNLQTIPDIMI